MVLLGNVLSFMGCVLMVCIGFIQNKNRILLTQCVQFVFQGAAHLILGAVSGFACCIVSILRNLVFAKVKSTSALKIIFILIQVILTLAFGSFAPIEMLPILSTVIFNWFLDTPNLMLFKIILIITQAMWMVYDFSFSNYVAAAFDVMAIASNMGGIWLILKNKKAPR